MTREGRSNRPRRGLSAAVVGLACLLAPGGATAASAPSGGGDLSPRLARLAQPWLRSAPPRRQAAALSIAPRGPGSLAREGGRVLVEVRFERGAGAALGDLRAAGARIVGVSRRYQTVTAAVPPERLRALAAVPRVGGVSEVLAPVTRAADCGGAVRSEGDGQLSAAAARAAFAVDGSGVTVGILSDSFDRRASAATHAAGDVASGDLPGPGSPCGSQSPVGVLDDGDLDGTDEGRAMAQIVHDLAPGAKLLFASATASKSQLGFAAAIGALRKAGAGVLADDIFYLDEPFFQEGPVATAIDAATAAGVPHFSAAGNDNLFEAGTGNPIGSWEAPEFRDSGACPAAIVALSEAIEAEEELAGEAPQGLHPEHCMDFDPGEGAEDQTLGITVPPGGEILVDLQYAEPWFGVQTDLDAFLLDETGALAESEGFPALAAEDNVGVSQEPFEYLRWENAGSEDETVQLVVNRFSGTGARLKIAFVQSDVTALEHPQSEEGDVVGPTVFGHAGARSAIATGAIRYDNGATPERFSSRGPLTHYFGPVRAADPAPPIPPDSISKPDLVATDGGANTFFGALVGGTRRFFGTSAAAPHAAAVAALMKQANPGISPARVRAALTATAHPVGGFGPDDVGAGRIDAFGAVADVALPPVISITSRPAALDRNRQPAIGFTASRPVAFRCSLDGAAPQPCGSPFVPPPLGDGLHGFAVQGVDAAGRVGTSETVAFQIDTRRPRTFFRKRPRKLLRTRHRRAKAVFRFGSNEPGVSFFCKVDSGLLHPCKRRFARRFKPGRHVLRVRALDAAGNVGRTAVFRFRVKRVRRASRHGFRSAPHRPVSR